MQPHSLCGHSQRGPVAQLAEQQTLNLLVVGSIPTGLTTLFKINKLQGSVRTKNHRSPTDCSSVGSPVNLDAAPPELVDAAQVPRAPGDAND